MNVQKEYKRGGFFGNSQDKFSDMEGAGQGINTAFKGMGPFSGKGSALRREKRYLKKLERQGKLNNRGTQSMDRLNYLKKVQKDRGKKIAAGAALAAGTALTAGALAGAAGAGAAGTGAAGAATGATGAAAGGAAGGAGLSGVGGAAAKMTLGDKILKGLKIGKAGKDLIAPNQNQMTPEQEAQRAQQEQDLMEGVNEAGGNYNYDYGGPGGKYGMRILKQGGLLGGQKRLDKNNDGRLSREDFELLRAMFGAKLPR